MSSIDLILLGLVFEQPRSAYDIQKNVEYRNLSRWVKISTPSIYKKVIRLEEKGWLKSTLTKEGKMPEKSIYAITEKGRERFYTLMADTAAAPVNVFFEFNAVVANLNKLPKDEALKRIADIKENISVTCAFMEKMAGERTHIPLVGQTILLQQQKVLEALLDWADAFADAFDREE